MTSRRVLISGASKGIGYALAERLAAAGHRPVGLARTAPSNYPGEFHPADLADRGATAEVLDKDTDASSSWPICVSRSGICALRYPAPAGLDAHAGWWQRRARASRNTRR
jgi:NAD(P)-dependent dehydrogenase (short-subunit alcohol dehydrogenase family)